jgi:maleamate amidohydrolase
VSEPPRHPDKPWLDVIPREDVEAFAGGYDSIDRPITRGERPALILVDLTRAFVDSAYPTGWSPTGWPAVKAAAELLAAARESGVPVYFSRAFENPEHRLIRGQNGRWKPSQSLEVDADMPPGDVIVDELAPRDDEIVINKQRKPSAFFGTTLASDLMYDGVDTTIIAGLTTSGCVRASAIDAFQYNFHVLVAQDACADRSQISHAVTLFDLHMKYADVIGQRDALEVIRSAGR